MQPDKFFASFSTKFAALSLVHDPPNKSIELEIPAPGTLFSLFAEYRNEEVIF